ncbi:MAG: hypothetical protein ACK53E_26545, partial [Pseudanabaena sp.]
MKSHTQKTQKLLDLALLYRFMYRSTEFCFPTFDEKIKLYFTGLGSRKRAGKSNLENKELSKSKKTSSRVNPNQKCSKALS